MHETREEHFARATGFAQFPHGTFDFRRVKSDDKPRAGSLPPRRLISKKFQIEGRNFFSGQTRGSKPSSDV